MGKLKNFSWQRLMIITVLFSYFYVFMEWVFFATKPSFMSGTSFFSMAKVFFGTGGLVAFVGGVFIIVFYAISLLLSRLKIGNGILLYFTASVPSAVLSVLSLILLDNFTYTVFKFGVVSLSYLLRGVYALGFVILFFYFMRWSLRFVCNANMKSQRTLLTLAGILSLFSIVLIIRQFQLPTQQETGIANVNKRPNVLIIGSDGVNADNMSVYGYEHKTTPFLEQVSPDFLIAENAFTNGGRTKISIVSILTGKLPAQTGIISNNNILLGADAYQHLPAILRGLGYYNVQIGVPQHVDSFEANLQNGFDLVNGRSYDQSPVFQRIRKAGLGEEAYFLSTIFERASSRILHIFYLREMENPIEAVTNDEHAGLSDQEKVAQIIDLVKNTQSPLFVQSHLMGTHGPTFNPANRVFSLNKEQDQEWMGDFYDDTILDFDGYIKEIMDALSKSGKLENTILVIYSDHNMLWKTNQRIPLLMRFPGKEGAGHVKNNAQNIDIAPTILDNLGIEKPIWMSGQSLLRSALSQNRLILNEERIGDVRIDLGIVQCNRWYRVVIPDGIWFTGEIAGHTAPCEHLDIVNKADLPAEIGNYLTENGAKIQDRPDNNAVYSNLYVTRGQAASILLQKKYGISYVPPPASNIFSDILASDLNIDSMEQTYRDGVIESCSSSPLSFCPDQAVTREEVAMFLLRSLDGSDYQPPSAKGIFIDMPASSPYASWVEELYARGITKGCKADPLSYCPSVNIRGEDFAIFLNRAFSQP